MKLYLVQHGDALPKNIDPERGLSEKGVEDVTKIATFLENSGIKIEHIFHSGKKRAEQTAMRLQSCLISGGEFAQVEGIAPLDPVDAVAREAEDWHEDTMLVGHLPYMGKLVSRLVAGDENIPLVTFQPGTIVLLERMETEVWVIVSMIQPKLLAH